MRSILKNLPKQRWPWLLLATSALLFELCALYFQHVMKLDPCVMCIYERIPVIGIFICGLLGASAPQNLFIRLIAFSTWIVSAVWGALLSIEHVDYQFNPSPFATCDFYPNFPSWAPLHQWVPWLFNPTGDCSDIVWQLLGYSMPQWLIISFVIYALIFIVVVIGTLLPAAKK